MKTVKESIPPHRSLPIELSELLQISVDSVYRRLRGETVLGIDETIKICNAYNISLDVLTKEDNHLIPFRYRTLGKGENSLYTILSAFASDLKQIQAAEGKEIIFAAEDIPIFHYFHYPELTAFKIFYWNRSILNVPSLQGKKFIPSLVNEDLIGVAKESAEVYATIPSSEIWTENTGNSMFKQVEFYWESGLFEKKQDALLVCDQLASMFSLLEKQAELNSKLPADMRSKNKKNNYILYNSEVMIGSNCVLVNLENTQVCYLSHHTFSTVATSNGIFCSETARWLENLIKKSIQISGVGEKQRLRFFANLHAKLGKLKNKIAEGSFYKVHA